MPWSSKTVGLLCLLATSALASSDTVGYKPLQDEGRSSFAPTSTNAHTMSRQVAPPPQPVIYAQSRDSYASAANPQSYPVPAAATQGGTAAAASSSYGAPATGGAQGGYQTPGQQSMTYYYYHYPAQQQQGGGYGGGYGGGEATGYDDDGFDGGSIGGLAGLIGLKGLKGLGGLGLLAILKLLKKLLLPLLLPFLLLLPLLLLFVPIPVITIPTGRRTLEASDGVGSYVASRAYQTAQVAQEVLTSAMCVERIACELSARTHGTYLDKVITQVFEKTESMSSKKWKRAMRAYIDSGFRTETTSNDTVQSSEPNVTHSHSACSKYACDIYKEVTNRFTSKNATTTTPATESAGNEVPT